MAVADKQAAQAFTRKSFLVIALTDALQGFQEL